MNSIPIVNQQLENILNNFKDELLSNSSKLKFKQRDVTKDYHYFCSEERLNELKHKVIGQTSDAWFLGLENTKLSDLNSQLNTNLAEWDNQRNYIVAKPRFVTERKKMFDTNALSAVYPANGYMSWHTNADASGYNVLLTWSETGNGFFKYQDPITKEIVTMPDKPGWNCKVGYFGGYREKDKLFWHCCGTAELRITVAWIFPTLEASLNFQNAIQQP
jgi:hypothetical protein